MPDNSQTRTAELILRLRDEMSRSAERMERRTRSLQDRLKSFKNEARETGLVVTAMATAVVFATQRAIAFGDNIGKTAQRIGIGAESLQEFRFAAQQAGADVQLFDTALTALIRRAGEAIRGNKAYADAFDDIGISVEELRQIKPEDLLNRVADALSQIEDQSLKVAAADRIMSEAGRRVINVFEGGAEAMDRQRKAARDLGLVMSEDLVQASEDASDQLGILTQFIKTQLSSALVTATRGFIRLFNIGEIQKMRSELEGLENTIRDLSNIQAKGPAVSVDAQLERAIKRRSEMISKLFELEGQNIKLPPIDGGNIDGLSKTKKAIEDAAKAAEKQRQANADLVLAQADAELELEQKTLETTNFLVEQRWKKEQELIEQTKEKMEEFREQAAARMERIRDGVGSVFTAMQSGMRDTVRGVLLGTQSIGDGFKNMFRNIALSAAEQLINSAISPLIGILTGGLTKFIGGLDLGGLFGFGGGGFAGPDTYPVGATYLQHGGIVQRGKPTIGFFEGHEDEAVVPLDSRRDLLGGGKTIVNVYNQAGADVESRTRDRSDGTKEVDLFIKKKVEEQIAGGRFDKIFLSNFGLARKGALRG